MNRSICIILLALLMPFYALAEAEISSYLQSRMDESAATGELIPIIAMFEQQADIASLDRQLSRDRAGAHQRAVTVIQTLKDFAAERQGVVVDFLQTQDAARVSQIEPYWVVNAIGLKASPAVIAALANQDGISYLDYDYEPVADRTIDEGPAPDVIPNGSEPGLRVVNADEMWRLGFDGSGIIVMNYDSGVDGNHVALQQRWLGNSVPADQAWRGSGTFPADGNGHGTHTMGTITGLSPTSNDTVGMAPAAEWMAADFSFNVFNVFQWSLDPDGNPNTSDDMPAVISNSWGFQNSTGGCQATSYATLLTNVEAAGVAIIFSAGNDGPGSTTITAPKNINTTPINSWATANINGNSPSLPIAGSSSRGPSGCGGTGSLAIKPEAAAPGSSVRSSVPGNGYAFFTGTSMAAPHVAGAVALLKQAFPNATPAEIKQALYDTAVESPADLASFNNGEPTGETSGEDNSYGRGVIDVFAAFQSFSLAPAPNDLLAYSDFNTPTGMSLTWQDPGSFPNGDTLLAADFRIQIYRDDVLVDSVDGGLAAYIDEGLSDGQTYAYTITTKLINTDLESNGVSFSWIAGGSPIPSAPLGFEIAGSQSEVSLSWRNPAENVDGTPLDDLAGVNLYQDGQRVVTFSRTPADAGSSDSAVFSPATPGLYSWYVTVIDNEAAGNESAPSQSLGTPLSLPINDEFTVAGAPNPGIWQTDNVDVNNRSNNPPSPPLALNLNGSPIGEDIIELRGINLEGLAGTGVTLTYQYQPQGNGNAPEVRDSLQLWLKNDAGEWLMARFYEGSPIQPFAEETVELDNEPAGAGSFFFGSFQIRFRSLGRQGQTANDDWFIDNLVLTAPTGIGDDVSINLLPDQYRLDANFPNPFNPSTSIGYQLPRQGQVSLVIYNVLGQKIRTLVEGIKNAGYHTAQWNGLNDLAQPVASGIYLYEFVSGPYRSIQKMILMK